MEVNGSHWSLLFYSRADEAFYYIDSIKNYNLSHAQVVFTKLEPYMCSSGPCSFNVVNSPQQRNGIECGIYLLIFVEWLVRGISARTEYETFDVEAYFGDLEVRDSDIIRKRAIMTYLTYNKQYKELKEEIAKELIFNISGKGDLETNQSKEKINIHERQPSHETCKITEEQVSAAKNTKCQQEFEDSLSFISGMEKWSVVKRKSMQGRFNHRCSLMQDKTTSQTVTANKYSILDRLSEICKKENESYDKNHCIKNHINPLRSVVDYKSTAAVSLNARMSTIGRPDNVTAYSQGSLLSSKLEELSNGKVNCFGYVRANTTLTQVADSASLWDDTSPVILLGGSNDSLNGNFQNIYSNLELKLHHLSKTRPVFITTVPIRYDKDLSSAENNDLRLVNSYITELTNRLDDVFLINLNGFKRFHYTAHGLHLNNRGKSKLAYVILNALSWWQSRNKSGNLEKITTTNSKPENHAQDFEQMSEFPRLPTAKNFRRVQMEETAADGSSTQDDLTLQLPQVSSISVESQSLLSNGLGINGPSVVEALDLSTAYCVNDSYDEDCNISVLSPCNSTNSDSDGSVFLGFSTPVNSCRKINVSKN
ncbi:SUMO1 sentrin specific peptidase 8 [Homalodisca vitripennis]|nr:SUMO1 sentrin specific peptidase 8 [Homalodisca vitripennis]